MSNVFTVRGVTSGATDSLELSNTDVEIALLDLEAGFWPILCATYDGKPHRVLRNVLIVAARRMQAFLDANAEVVPFRYGLNGEMKVNGMTIPLRGGGSVMGFHVDGLVGTIWCDNGVCRMELRQVDSHAGTNILVREVDLRREKSVTTDDWGTIKITRKKLKLRLSAELDALIAFLAELPGDSVEVSVAQRAESVMELVRQASQGGGEADAAQEVLFNRGEPARRELTQRLSEAKHRKYHPTIAFILLTILPSDDSRQAVERAAEVEGDEVRQRELLTLLAAVPKLPPVTLPPG